MSKSLPSPADLGAPDKYSKWRDVQLTALMDITGSEQPVVGINAPTGSGKMLLSIAVALATDSRTLILTESKGLQDAYAEHMDDGRLSFADIRGASNYPCPALLPGGRYAYLRESKGGKATCDAGPCKSGLPCKLREGGCPEFDALRKANSAQIVVSNYAKRLATAGAEEEPLGVFDRLVADEAHTSIDVLTRALTVELPAKDLRLLATLSGPSPTTLDLGQWKPYALRSAAKLEIELERAKDSLRQARDSGRVAGDLLREIQQIKSHLRLTDRLASARGSWVGRRVGGVGGSGVQFDSLWPADYCRELLTRDIPRSVFMSATLHRRLFKYLGVGTDQFDFFDYPSSFPLANRPVYVLPYGNMQWDMSHAEFQRSVDGIDLILSSRSDRKRIVHSVSYDYARRIIKASRNKDRMITCNRSEDTPDMIREFRKSKLPLIAVHPSIYTGYDFPGAAAELQVIAKLPFSDGRDPLNAARRRADKTYAYHRTMGYTEQAAGRIVRSDEDRGETFVTDGHAAWFLDTSGRAGTYVRDFASRSFAESIKRVNYLPKAPRALLGAVVGEGADES